MKRINPKLADLSQDIAGVVPVDLVKSWLETNRTATDHKKLLEPYYKTGYVVASDSAGLSKLSLQRNILDVLHLIEQPKQIIYEKGTALGGEAIGLWVADNTEMFYPDTVPAEDVVEAMVQAQYEIAHQTVQVGMAIHYGKFLHIGEGLFGTDADIVEAVAEDKTEGGEILISEALKKRLPKNQHKSLTQRTRGKMPFFHYNSKKQKFYKAPLNKKIPEYPAPFDKKFIELISTLDLKKLSNLTTISQQYAKEKYVVFLKIHHRSHKYMLDTFVDWTLANAVMLQAVTDFQLTKITSNGNIGIFVTDSFNEAAAFSQEVKSQLELSNLQVSIGVTKGEVLLFPLAPKVYQIAGEPVNIASKLAEDLGKAGKMYIHDSIEFTVEANESIVRLFSPFSYGISHVQLQGWELI